MATEVYRSDSVELVDGTVIRMTPLKIIYLREFMDKFEDIKKSTNDEESVTYLLECALIAMKQYYPEIKTIEDIEDRFDLPSIYKVVDVAAGISTKDDSKEKVANKDDGSAPTWESLDLAKLEAEVFLLGIWKDYEELESSLSMPELTATLESKRELDYTEKKFLAAIQGVDLDKQSGQKDAWEEMKARVFSGGKAADSNDVVALQGINAQKAGFGIGMGLDYVDLTKK
jgi:hypothetical protein